MTAFYRSLVPVAAALLLAGCTTHATPDAHTQRVVDAADGALKPKPAHVVPTRKLVPAISAGWTTQAQENEEIARKYHGFTPASNVDAEAALNATGLTSGAHFAAEGVVVEVGEEDLLYPGVHEALDETDWALLKDGRHIFIELSVYAKPGTAIFYPDAKALVSNCGPGVLLAANGYPAYRRLAFHHELAQSMFVAKPNPDDHSFIILIGGDPHAVTQCTLHLSRAVQVRHGNPVPDLNFKVIDGEHDTREILIRNTTPATHLAAR